MCLVKDEYSCLNTKQAQKKRKIIYSREMQAPGDLQGGEGRARKEMAFRWLWNWIQAEGLVKTAGHPATLGGGKG